MGSLIVNYYRKLDEKDTYQPQLDYGRAITFGIKHLSPFWNHKSADVEKGQTISAYYNNTVVAPTFQHKVKDTDFLLIRSFFGKIIKTYP